MAFVPGLVTITFRQLRPREIVDLATKAGLATLEWGGDVHVPPGDVTLAREVGGMTRDAGLTIAAYGSYCRLGEDSRESFRAQIETAVTLGAGAIRVWAGKRPSSTADAGYRQRVVDDALHLAEIAASVNVLICYEFHEGTLTDTDESALALLRATEHPAIRTLWQPANEQSIPHCVQSLTRMLPFVQHVHVFHWPRRGERAPLAEGAAAWSQYLNVLRENQKDCPLLLEFVANDDPRQFLDDAATLLDWIR